MVVDPRGMPSPGTMLDGKYRLVRQLGAGGMGIVYEADHIRLRQPFAIKILQPELAQESEFVARFEREARAAAVLRSPHIVRVFDVDVSSDGLSYMVMELLEGRDLAEEAVEGPIALAQLVDWVVQICSALQEAHDSGIVHRDLKPANIFLTKIESGERIAKVLDFGISKLEATSTSHTTGSASGTLGTPTYMAPEQIRGRRVDGRTDVWALGVMMYRLLAGRWPFDAKGDAAYMAAVVTDPPIPLEVVRPDLPHDLSGAIMKALEKDLPSRHQSATELAAALAPFGSGRGPLAVRTSLPASAIAPDGPMAIVMPASPEARSDPHGVMDTALDLPRTDAGSGPLHRLGSAPATVFVSPDTRRRRGPGAAIVTAACVVVALVAAGSYVLTGPRKVTKAIEVPAAAPGAPSAEPVPSAEVAPNIPSGRPAITGVPLAPSASAPVPRKRPVRPASAASAHGGAAPPPPPDETIPAHL